MFIGIVFFIFLVLLLLYFQFVEANCTFFFIEDEMDCLRNLFERCSQIEQFQLHLIMNEEFTLDNNAISRIMERLSIKELRLTGLDSIDKNTL